MIAPNPLRVIYPELYETLREATGNFPADFLDTLVYYLLLSRAVDYGTFTNHHARIIPKHNIHEYARYAVPKLLHLSNVLRENIRIAWDHGDPSSGEVWTVMSYLIRYDRYRITNGMPIPDKKFFERYLSLRGEGHLKNDDVWKLCIRADTECVQKKDH